MHHVSHRSSIQRPLARRAIKGLCSSLLALCAAVTQAQDAAEIPVSQLLFDPQPLPEANAPQPTFITPEQATSSATLLPEPVGNREEAMAQRQAALDEALKAAGDSNLDIAKAYRDFADWNLQVFISESTIAQNGSRIDTARFANMRGTSPNGGTPGEMASLNNSNNALQTTLLNLFQAKNSYLKSLDALLKIGDPANPDLLNLERQFRATLLLSMHRENFLYEPDHFLTRRSSATGTRLDTSTQAALNAPEYAEGSTSFQRSLDYIDKNKGRTAEQIASTLLEEADWDQMFERGKQATEKYDGAFQFFETSAPIKERAAAVVNPAVPVTLPAFLPAPNSRVRLGIAADKNVPWIGYFDVSFEIKKNGRAAAIKVKGQGGNVTDNMEQRLRENISRSVFRPRYAAGKLSDEPYVLRYYVGY